LSIGELNCLLWMDESGRVLELRETGAPFVEPVCFIDVSTKTLRKEADVLHFDVYEQNSMRTRWRLPPDKTAGTVTKKILFREKSGIDLCLGTLRLQLKHVVWDIKEFSPGLYQLQFHGLMIEGPQQFSYEKATGKIYSAHEWDNKLSLKQNRSQTTNSGAQTIAAIPAQERVALIALYNSTDGDNWNNNSGWKTPPLALDGFALPGTENTWNGIICGTGNTTVQRISLWGNNLKGVLPPELGTLANLTALSLGGNKISGPIPRELGNLANLKDIRFSYNQLIGNIPQELANLSNLYILDIIGNQLSGTIPPELGELANLQSLNLSWNQLSGIIPSELGNLANLYSLRLNGNRLSGIIPPELGNLANLYELWLSVNQLSGSIPSQLGNLANLQIFVFYSNHLSGSIPPELGNLVNLQILYLYGNQLGASIPPELGNLANLQGLALSLNNLSGSIPPELGNLQYLEHLNLSSNQLNGSIPPQLGNLANLNELSLGWNQLSGSIPHELGNLTNLNELVLCWNQLSGNIPPELGYLGNLQYLYLHYNQFSGSIPPELGNLANLQYLYLGSNQLNGSIPPQLGNLTNLQYLYLGSNQLNGSIPPQLGNLTKLEYLHLGSNQLSGSIPSNLTNLTNLWNNWSDLRWNALYTNDDILKDFLNLKQIGGNWANTQTIAPSNVAATSISTTSININWTPITYTSGTGGYRVFYSTTPGGPYTYFNMTADKTESSLTVTGLNPGAIYYFVVQARTYPHYYNQNTVDSEYSAEVSASTLNPLILTSPNGGESWGLSTIRDITWTSSGLSGNIQLELWKADKKLGNIAANIPIGNGNYAWFVGNCGPGVASPGNDYKVKIITANGLYNDASNAAFSIVQPSITLTSPHGNESWKLGTQQDITWTSAGLTGNVKLLLFKGGVQVGVIARGIPIANGTYAWTVGKNSGGMAPVGSNYSVKIRSEDNRFYNSGSGAFKIW
ncbi:MAG: leucine-rich repeat domain-containing protein, partial [Candidatus Aminicenantes bacterium]|nr:leucine-rich repeat domain-containing protein [Candidatus Aminicenantes bacterium]